MVRFIALYIKMDIDYRLVWASWKSYGNLRLYYEFFSKVTESLTKSGSFTVGANYWASRAGTNMWVDWRPELVDRDLKTLVAAVVQVLRVSPHMA